MDRVTAYLEEVPYAADFLSGQRWPYEALGLLALDLFGTSMLAAGLACAPTAVPSLGVLVGPGRVYSFQNLEPTAWGQIAGIGGFAADTNVDHNVVKQGVVRAAQTLTLAAPVTPGQSICYLLQVSFAEADAATVSRSFYNPSTPASPTSQFVSPSRNDVAVVSLKAGIAATTGSQTVPAPDANNAGVSVITCAYGQTAINVGDIAAYASAPLVLTQAQIQALISARYGPTNPPSIPNVTGLVAALAGITPGLAQGQIVGLGLSNTVGTPLTQITVSVGTTRDSTNSTDLVLAAPLTKSISSVWAAGGGGNSCRDGAAYAANGYCWFFLIWNPASPSSPDVVSSLSATAPTLPTGYTKFRRLGGITFDGSGNVRQFTQVGRRFNYLDSCVVDVATGSSQGTAPQLRQLLGVPLGVKLRPIVVLQSNGTVDATAYLEAYTDPDEGVPTLGGPTQFAQIRRTSGGVYPSGFGNYGYYCGSEVACSASGQVYTISSDAGAVIALKTKGWIDDQGGFN